MKRTIGARGLAICNYRAGDIYLQFQLQVRMRKMKAILCIEEYKERRKHFLKHEESDVYVLLDSKVVGFHKAFLCDSHFLTKEFEEENRKICLLDDQINSLVFYKVVGCLYGLECCFERSWEAIPVYSAVVKLGIKMLQGMMERDFRNNFDEYGFFVLFTLAQKFGIDWLRGMCKEQLLVFGFEQLNFNKSDFLQCEKSVADALIQVYREFSNVPKLLPKEKMKSIMGLYCRVNNLKMEVSYLQLTQVENIIMETDSEENSPSEGILQHRKRFQLIDSEDTTCSNMSLANSLAKPAKPEPFQKLSESNILDGYPTGSGQVGSEEQEAEILEFNEREFSFTNISHEMESNFLQAKQSSQETKKEKKEHRKAHRSTSPPASPWTPQFGEYIGYKQQRSKEEGRKINPKKQYLA